MLTYVSSISRRLICGVCVCVCVCVCVDNQGWTPLVYADFMQNRECVVALLQPHKPDVCANQLRMLGALLQTDRGETTERVIKVIEYCSGIPEFYEAINRLVQV
jgi:hypothetical protein